MLRALFWMIVGSFVEGTRVLVSFRCAGWLMLSDRFWGRCERVAICLVLVIMLWVYLEVLFAWEFPCFVASICVDRWF